MHSILSLCICIIVGYLNAAIWLIFMDKFYFKSLKCSFHPKHFNLSKRMFLNRQNLLKLIDHAVEVDFDFFWRSRHIDDCSTDHVKVSHCWWHFYSFWERTHILCQKDTYPFLIVQRPLHKMSFQDNAMVQSYLSFLPFSITNFCCGVVCCAIASSINSCVIF